MSAVSKIAIVLSSAVFFSACAVAPPRTSAPNPHYKVGNPYKVNGRTYRPAVDPNYNRVGLASWYGSDFHRKPTANGEIFDKNRISAAHKTLPLPSIVEVRNLENGRRLFVRVNDRGPFVDDRIIDLSEAAARALGFHHKGLAKVRVRYVREAALHEAAPRRVRVYSQNDADNTPANAPLSTETGSVPQQSAAEAERLIDQEGQTLTRADAEPTSDTLTASLSEAAPAEISIAEPQSLDVFEESGAASALAGEAPAPSIAPSRRALARTDLPAPPSLAETARSAATGGVALEDFENTTPILGAAIAPVDEAEEAARTTSAAQSIEETSAIEETPLAPSLWVVIGSFATFDALEAAQSAIGERNDYAVFDEPQGEGGYILECGPFETDAAAEAFLKKAIDAGFDTAETVEKP